VTRLWKPLQADHDRICKLLDQISGGSGQPPTDVKDQRRRAKRLVILQSAHEFAEELVIWPLVVRHCEDGDELAEEGLQQESLLKRALNELFALSAGTEEFMECVNTVATENRSHLTYEQNQIWPRLGDAMDDDMLDQVARRWLSVRRTAPTRPHPHLPARPEVLRAFGPVLAARGRAADRMRNQHASTADGLAAEVLLNGAAPR
jgi:hypothetical protein